jgi:predicted Zn finger-like uncharacterized protein
MKIFCTHCQAGYRVDLPDIKPAGVKFKCAKCQQKFLVKPQGADQVQENVSSQATAAAGATGALPDEGDSDMPEDEKQPETTDTGDDELDDFLDDLLNEDENKEGEETPADSTSEENEEETTGEETTETVAEESEKTETATPDEDIPPEEASEEDLWAQAFADQDAVEEGQTATETAEADEGEAAVEDEEGEGEGEGEEDELGVGEEYDGEEFEIAPKKKFGLPTTKTGKMIAVGCVAALLLTGGGLYFGWKTFAPEELLQMGKSDTEIPDELTPKPEEGTDIKEPEAEGEGPLEEAMEPEQKQEQVGEKKEEPAPEKGQRTRVAGGEEDKKSDLAKELAQSNALKDAVEGGDDEGLLAALSPEETQITLSTIMPVAFDATDIRVLSFDILIETSDRPSTQVIREALPIYEKVTMNTVEQFLRNKFYNDILYVKEKLQRRLQHNFNKKIEGSGRVKKVKFTEFMIQ